MNEHQATCPICNQTEDNRGLCPQCGVDLVFCNECQQAGYHTPDCPKNEESENYAAK